MKRKLLGMHIVQATDDDRLVASSEVDKWGGVAQTGADLTPLFRHLRALNTSEHLDVVTELAVPNGVETNLLIVAGEGWAHSVTLRLDKVGALAHLGRDVCCLKVYRDTVLDGRDWPLNLLVDLVYGQSTPESPVIQVHKDDVAGNSCSLTVNFPGGIHFANELKVALNNTSADGSDDYVAKAAVSYGVPA